MQVTVELTVDKSCCDCVFCSNGNLPRHCKYVQLSDSRSVEGDGLCQVSIPGVYRLPGEVSDARCRFSAPGRITPILDCVLAGASHVGLLVTEYSSVKLHMIATQSQANGRMHHAKRLFFITGGIYSYTHNPCVTQSRLHLGIFKKTNMKQ